MDSKVDVGAEQKDLTMNSNTLSLNRSETTTIMIRYVYCLVIITTVIVSKQMKDNKNNDQISVLSCNNYYCYCL